MKSTPPFKTIIAILVTALTLSFASTGLAQRVLQANATAKGRLQSSKTVEDQFGDPVDLNLIKGTPAINSKVLINLALGNNPSAVVPPNLVLALSICEGDGLIVYDKNTQSTVVVVATADINEENILHTEKIVCTGSGDDRICDVTETSFEGLLTLTFNNVGNDQFGIMGGTVQLYAKGNSSGGCPIKFSGNGTGALDVTTTSNDPDIGDVTTTTHVLLQKFTISTSAKLLDNTL